MPAPNTEPSLLTRLPPASSSVFVLTHENCQDLLFSPEHMNTVCILDETENWYKLSSEEQLSLSTLLQDGSSSYSLIIITNEGCAAHCPLQIPQG